MSTEHYSTEVFIRSYTRRVATCTQSTQLRTHCRSREHVAICNKILTQCTDRSFCECSRTTQAALRGIFFQTLTEKSIAIQNMRVQRYDRDVKDDNGSNELVDLRNRNTFVQYFIMVLINVSLVFLLA